MQRLSAVTIDAGYGAYVKRSIDSLVATRWHDQDVPAGRLQPRPDQRRARPLCSRRRDRTTRATGAPPTNCARSSPRNRARPTAGSGTSRSIPQQMWLDGLYMAEPFYAEFAARKADTAAMTDVTRQFLIVAQHLRDSTTGLYYHAWDSARRQPWADPATGRVEEHLGPGRRMVLDGGRRRPRLPAGQTIRTARRSFASCSNSPTRWRACRTR